MEPESPTGMGTFGGYTLACPDLLPVEILAHYFELHSYQRFYRALLCIRGTSHGPVSVRLSVTSQSFTKTAKHRITRSTPHDSPGTLVL